MSLRLTLAILAATGLCLTCCDGNSPANRPASPTHLEAGDSQNTPHGSTAPANATDGGCDNTTSVTLTGDQLAAEVARGVFDLLSYGPTDEMAEHRVEVLKSKIRRHRDVPEVQRCASSVASLIIELRAGYLRLRVIDVMEAFGPDAFDGMTTAIDYASDADFRNELFRPLASWIKEEPRLADRLIRYLDDPVLGKHAATAIANGGEIAQGLLMDVLREPDWYATQLVRTHIMRCLWVMGCSRHSLTDESLDFVAFTILNDDDAELREWTCRWMPPFANDAVWAALEHAAQADPVSTVRDAAARALVWRRER